MVERGDCRPVTIACGHCIGCRLERSRRWAIRCLHESQMHDFSSFVTLTYDDNHVPRSLEYAHFQRFIDRLRKRLKIGVRYYMSGEYGDRTGRPHFHACLFGVHFSDRLYYRKSPAGSRLYKSAFLDDVWGMGLCSIGEVTFESAAYAARYICKKVTGDDADKHYTRVDPATGEVYRVEPEFCHMSLKPGIGATWFEKYKSEVFPNDYVVIGGVKCKPPKYYKDLLRNVSALECDDVEYARAVLASKPEFVADNTADRLAVREVVTRARLSFKSRDLGV